VCSCFRTEVQFLEELGGNGYAACGTDSVEGVLGVVVGGEVGGWGSSWRGVSSGFRRGQIGAGEEGGLSTVWSEVLL